MDTTTTNSTKTRHPHLAEGGITEWSLDNATYLLAARGLPARVEICQMSKVVATWIADGGEEIAHTFEGFAWGYRGEGPRGLSKFFEMIGATSKSFDRDSIAGWREENFATKTLVRGIHYHSGPTFSEVDEMVERFAAKMKPTIGIEVNVTRPTPNDWRINVRRVSA